MFKSVFDKGTIAVIFISIIIFCLISGGTLANRTTKGEVINKISSSSVSVKLINKLSDGSDMPEAFYSILPNTVIDNVVSAKNTGKEPEYIRISLTPKMVDKDGTDLKTDSVYFQINSENWTYKDGFYYYNNILNIGETAPSLYDSILFGPQIGNDYRFATFSVDINVDAVQSVNNYSPLEAQGWEEPT